MREGGEDERGKEKRVREGACSFVCVCARKRSKVGKRERLRKNCRLHAPAREKEELLLRERKREREREKERERERANTVATEREKGCYRVLCRKKQKVSARPVTYKGRCCI